MMKKSLIKCIAVSLLLPPVCFSASNVQSSPPTNFTGLYTGLGLGIQSTIYGLNATSSFSTTTATVTGTSYAAQSGQVLSALGEFELGYGAMYPHDLYLGINGFLDLSRKKYSSNVNLVNSIPSNITDLKTADVKLDALTYGLGLEPGISLTPQTLLYALVGWERAKETLTINQDVNITTASSGSQSATNENNLNGLRVGIGVRQLINQALAIGLRYRYTEFFNGYGVSTPVTNTTGSSLTGPYSYSLGNPKVSSQAVSATLDYYFDAEGNVVSLPEANPTNFAGFYLSASIGSLNPSLSGSNAVLSASYTDVALSTNTPELTMSLPQYSDTTTANIAVGFGKVFANNVYLDIEGSIARANNSFESNINQSYRPASAPANGQAPDRFDYDAKIKAWDFEPSVDVKLGVIMPHQLLGYLRAGVAINKIELTTNDRLTYRAAGGDYQSYTLSAQDSPGTKAHLRLGGGLDFEYTPYNTFNLSYVYTYYGKFNASSSLSTTDIAGGPVSFSDNTKFRLATNTVTIGYTHYFSHA